MLGVMTYERKAATLAPMTGTATVDPARATVRMVAAVSGTVDSVGDKIIPGAFQRSLRSRTPAVCRSHDWACPIGRIVSIKELMPGDPGLPRMTGSGRPWPREAGALVAEARLNTAIPAGRDAYEMIKFLGGDAAFSIGFKTVRARQRGGVRELLDVELYEISPVLHGAHNDARLIEAKAGRPVRLEYKSSAAAAGMLTGRRAAAAAIGSAVAGDRQVIRCAACNTPAAVIVGGLPEGRELICAACLSAVTIDDLVDPAVPGAREEWEQAQRDDQPWHLDADGEPRPGDYPAWRRT